MPFILQSLAESWDVHLLIDRDKNYVVLMCIRYNYCIIYSSYCNVCRLKFIHIYIHVVFLVFLSDIRHTHLSFLAASFTMAVEN